jgi:hypothetical protein
MSRDGAHVSVSLDLRRASSSPQSARDFVELWERVAPQLLGKLLASDHVFELSDPKLGQLALRVMGSPGAPAPVSASTKFAIHAVLEPLRVVHACGVCAGTGRRTHAPFVCGVCDGSAGPGAGPKQNAEAPATDLCDEHVVLLEGSLRSFCPAHRPHCGCGRPAGVWCFGPGCRKQRGRGFCHEHVRAHPSLPDLFFCEACYEELFPPCQAPGCAALGKIRCSHVDESTDQRCGKAFCAEHAKRWQIYGPHQIGLGRCEEHGDLKRIDDLSLIYQIVASAQLQRRGRGGGGWQGRLPTLQTLTHILMKPRGRRYALAEINGIFDRLQTKLSDSRPFQARMVSDLEETKPQRIRDLQRDESEKVTGKPYFERLQALVLAAGLREVAQRLEYADFRPNGQLLFVKLPAELRGWFVGGRSKHRLLEFESKLGVKILFNRDGDK